MKILPPISHRRRTQSGAALIVSLILLSVLTILAVSASQTTRMQERMAGNARDADMAFQAAEAGVRNAEKFLGAMTKVPDPCSALPCNVFQTNFLPLTLGAQSESWWTNSTTGYGKEYGVAGTQEIPEIVEDPRYVIEYAGFVPDDLSDYTVGKDYFRATSRSKGVTDTAIAVVQTVSTYRMDP